MKKITLLSLLIALTFLVFGNNGIDPLKKQTKAMRIDNTIEIDGILDDEAWQNAPNTNNFIQKEPQPGISALQSSEVKILYDNNAIYIGAKLLDFICNNMYTFFYLLIINEL